MRNVTLAIAGLALALAAPGLSQPAVPKLTFATKPEEAAAVKWLRASGKAFDPAAYGEAELAPLAALLGQARVIGIGEATHGSHQDQQFKAELIKQLVRSGKMQVLVLEANRDAGYRIDRYVRFGEGDPAQVLRTGSFFQIWKDDEFAGLILWLRAWNQTAPSKVRVIGIDNQDGGRDSLFALNFIKRFDAPQEAGLRAGLGTLLPADGSEPGRFLNWYVKASDAELAKATTTIAAMQAWFDQAPAAARQNPGFDDARWAVETARQSFVIYEVMRPGFDMSKATPEQISARDRFMAGNAIGMLHEGERAAIWAHDGHVVDELSWLDLQPGYVSLGSLLEEKLGEQYATVGFTWSSGTFRAARIESAGQIPSMALAQPSDVVTLPNDRPGELGHLFNQTGQRAMWIDLSTRPQTPLLNSWARRPYWRGWAGWGVLINDWQKIVPDGELPPEVGKGHDVIVWFRTISPSRLWPVKPR